MRGDHGAYHTASSAMETWLCGACLIAWRILRPAANIDYALMARDDAPRRRPTPTRMRLCRERRALRFFNFASGRTPKAMACRQLFKPRCKPAAII